MTTPSCEIGGGAQVESDDADVVWRDAAPAPAQIAQDVATLRNQPFVLDPSVAVGTLPGRSDVGSRGNATWNLPIDPAPGVAGMTPELSIVYGSERGNGPLGVGFALSGMPTIRRCVRTIIDDEAAGGILWTNGDALCLGGDRLVLEGGTQGRDGAQYRLANDPTVRIVQHRHASSLNSWFEAFYANGSVFHFGTADATQWRGPNASFAQPYVWGLLKRIDRFNNSIDYAYDFPQPLPTGPGEMRLRTIRYGGLGIANTRRELSFDYEQRPDELDTWWFGSRQRVATRLSRITAKGPAGVVVRSYRLAYETAGDAERSHLATLQMCDASNTCMPPTAFEWGEPPDEAWGHSIWDYDGDVAHGLNLEAIGVMLVAMRGAMVTDMDGDLKQELLLRRESSGPTSAMFWRPFYDMDFAFDLPIPSPPALPEYLDEQIEASPGFPFPGPGPGLPTAKQLARVQPPLTAAVVNANGDRLSDILTPKTPYGQSADLDSDGYLYGQGFWLSYGQSTPLGMEPQSIDVNTTAGNDRREFGREAKV